MKFSNIQNMKSPPIVGQTYIVPTIYFNDVNFCFSITKIPVLLPGHVNDFSGKDETYHYHPDNRFVNTETEKALNLDMYNIGFLKNGISHVGEETWICVREQFYPDNDGWLEEEYKHIKLNLQCKKCPHRGTDLSSMPVINGKITCPAHLLTWNSETGDLIRSGK